MIGQAIVRAQLAALCVAIALMACGRKDSQEAAPESSRQPAPQVVLLEIDRMVGTSPIEVTQTIGTTQVSLADIYQPANFQLRIEADQTDIPRQEKVRLADLHALMEANSSKQAQSGDWKVYALVLTEDQDDPETLGIMFDFGANDPNDMPREAFAIFEAPHRGLAGGLTAEVLLTTVHELAHVFNLHHTDWEGQSFSRASTVEGYSLTDSVRWSLSAASLAHLKSSPRELVLPGAGGLPFGLITLTHARGHKATPLEAYQIVADDLSGVRRGNSIQQSIAASSAAARAAPASTALPQVSSPLKLVLEAPQQEFLVGEAMTLTVALLNTGDEVASVIPFLSPEYRFLSIAIKGPQDQAFWPFRPPLLREGRKAAVRELAPGETLHAEAKVFFGADGWTFETPGQYEIQAAFPADSSLSGDVIQSETLRVNVQMPRTEPTTRARRLLLSEDGQRLGTEQGLYLYMGGGDHLTTGGRRLRELVNDVPNAPQAGPAKLALASEALRPTVDPARRVRPQTRLDEALRYAGNAQEYEGVSALTLLRVQGQLIDELQNRGRSSEAQRLRDSLKTELATREDVKMLNRRALTRDLE